MKVRAGVLLEESRVALVVVSLLAWGDRHAAPDGPPVLLEHRGCGGRMNDRRICEACGALLGPRDVKARLGLAPRGSDEPVQPALAG